MCKNSSPLCEAAFRNDIKVVELLFEHESASPEIAKIFEKYKNLKLVVDAQDNLNIEEAGKSLRMSAQRVRIYCLCLHSFLFCKKKKKNINTASR